MAKRPTRTEMAERIGQLEHELLVKTGQYDEWEEPIKHWLIENRRPVGDQRHSSKSILTGALSMREEVLDRAAFYRLHKIMKRNGWKQTILETLGVRARGWCKSNY